MKTWMQLFLCALLGLAAAAGGWQGTSAAAPLAPAGALQTMIDNAADGDSLDIAAGTYTENLTIGDKNLTLRGANRATTIIQAASSSGRVIYANSNKGLRLENLTIKGGHPSGVGGGGVYAAGGTLQIVNCRITDNSAFYGGGVFLDHSGSSLVVSNSVIDLNTATAIGGGLYAFGSATLYNTAVDSNSAGEHGGGLHVQDGSTAITGGVFSSNHANNGNGGAVNVNNALTISGAQFTGNTSTNLGGAVNQWNDGFAVSITGSVFTSNSAKSKGGGAYIAGPLILTTTTFTTNTVDSSGSGDVYGGGVYAGGPAPGGWRHLQRQPGQMYGLQF